MAKPPKISPAARNLRLGAEAVRYHPMFTALSFRTNIAQSEGGQHPANGWARVSSGGTIHVHPKRLADPDEWAWAIAHCMLHLGMGHFQQRLRQREWDLACDCVVYRFLETIRLGEPPEPLRNVPLNELPVRNEEGMFRHFCDAGIPDWLPPLSLTGAYESDMILTPEKPVHDWERLFGEGLTLAVSSAVSTVGGLDPTQAGAKRLSAAALARRWFLSSYPLLGALASSFEIIEDPVICRRLEVSVAAVNAYAREIYVNPAAGLGHEELRFVIAHELLHVALEHQKRRRGRDPEMWNVACDFVINDWLIEMQVGAPPPIGLLFDPALRGLSAESVYDRIVKDMRRYRKLQTFRGRGLGDMLDPAREWWLTNEGVSLDEYYRRCLAQGLHCHEAQCRGLLPAALVEEIRALGQPPIPWDVELARWFDDRFPPVEKRRTYARQSRRQASTPDIPRPRYTAAADDPARTFGVVLDTSGSMDRVTLAEALGAIASYALSREVASARVVFCDAEAYDAGYLAVEAIAGKVQVRGRGGTVLQPGIDLLECARDFPKTGPILIITDGWCDHFTTSREHAILLPEGRTLPFTPRGKLFYLSGL